MARKEVRSTVYSPPATAWEGAGEQGEVEGEEEAKIEPKIQEQLLKFNFCSVVLLLVCLFMLRVEEEVLEGMALTLLL